MNTNGHRAASQPAAAPTLQRAKIIFEIPRKTAGIIARFSVHFSMVLRGDLLAIRTHFGSATGQAYAPDRGNV